MKTLLKLAVVGFAAALLASGPLVAADSMTESLRPLKGEEFEMSFLSQMIEHHKQGIEMANLVPHHSQRAELKQFADKMSRMQQAENGKMSSLLNSGAHGAMKMDHGKTDGMKMDHSKMEGMKMDGKMSGMKMDGMKMPGMAQLESAQGPEFDRAFVQEMIKHHAMAVEMAQLAKGRTTRSEVLQLADNIVKEQTGEIKTLKGWQAKWFK